jgi:hypothetical protein
MNIALPSQFGVRRKGGFGDLAIELQEIGYLHERYVAILSEVVDIAPRAPGGIDGRGVVAALTDLIFRLEDRQAYIESLSMEEDEQ